MLESKNQIDPSQANLEEDPELADLESRLENIPKPFWKEYDADDHEVDKRVKMRDLLAMH